MTYKLCSLLLQYPDEELVGARDEIADAIAALPALARVASHSGASASGGREPTRWRSLSTTSRRSTCTSAAGST